MSEAEQQVASDEVQPTERVWSKSALGLAIGLPLSAFFLWLAVRDADLDTVWSALADADLALVLVGAVSIFIVFGLQTVRWRSVAAVRTLRLRRLYGMLLSALACNNVLPIRIGELLRARWLSVEAPMPGGRALGSVALDRACDVVTLALLLGVGLFAVTTTAWLERMVVVAILAVVAIAAALVFARVYTAARPQGRRERGRLRRILRDIVEMLAEPVGRRRATAWIALSLTAWLLSSTTFLIVARALDLRLGLLDAVFVTAVLSLGTAIPSSPGYVGTYQWLGVESLGLLDVPVNEALAVTILYHATWYIPTTVAGGLILGSRALRSARARRGPTVSPS